MRSSTADQLGASERSGTVGRSTWLARERAWTIAVWASMAVWTGVLFVIVRDGFLNFRVGRFDLGNMVQAVWSTSEGRFLEITNGATGEQELRLGSHADPFLALLSPAWLAWPSPLSLALAQIVAVALGALPVYWLGRKHLASERAAGLLALAYLAYPWLAVTAVASIHPVTFAISFFLFAIWFLDSGRLVAFAVCALLAMTTGELVGLPIAALGVWYAVSRKERVAGGAIAAAGALWTFVAVYLIVPASSGGASVFYNFYESVGDSPQGLFRMLFTDPLAIVGALLDAHDIAYVLLLGMPLLFLFVLSPGLALVALPQLLANTLSDFRSMSDPRYHSIAAVVPFLVAATVFGISRVRTGRQLPLAAVVLVCSAVFGLAVGPWARAVGWTPLGGRASVPPDRATALADAVALIPSGAAVSASNTAGAHLSARRYIYSIPNLGRADWVVVDTADPWVVSRDSPILSNRPAAVGRFVERLQADASWSTEFERSGVVGLSRTDG